MSVVDVCVIEDDDATREPVRELLEEEGYRVIEAANGLDGLALLHSAEQRLVVALDHKLPALDGCDLLDIVAHDALLRERHAFIFMTASPNVAQEDCEEAVEELNATILPKPFSIDEMARAVRQAALSLGMDSTGEAG